MADKEIKITTLTEQQREVLKSKTPFILPDNPSQKGYSASQIKKTMYEPVLLLFDWLKRQGLETKEAFEYLNNYIFEKGNALSEDIENSKKYAKDLVDNLALTVDGNLTESKNYTDLEIDKVELDYNNKFANVTKDVTEKHQAVTKRLDEHDNDISVIEKQIAEISNIGKANLQIIESIDQVVEQNVIYLIKDETATGEDIYREYILANGEAILIGSTSVDLRPYITAEQIAEIYATKKGVTEEIDGKIGDIDSLLDELNGTATFEENPKVEVVNVPQNLIIKLLSVAENTEVTLTDEEMSLFNNAKNKVYYSVLPDVSQTKIEYMYAMELTAENQTTIVLESVLNGIWIDTTNKTAKITKTLTDIELEELKTKADNNSTAIEELKNSAGGSSEKNYRWDVIGQFTNDKYSVAYACSFITKKSKESYNILYSSINGQQLAQVLYAEGYRYIAFSGTAKWKDSEEIYGIAGAQVISSSVILRGFGLNGTTTTKDITLGSSHTFTLKVIEI